MRRTWKVFSTESKKEVKEGERRRRKDRRPKNDMTRKDNLIYGSRGHF